ncbi:MAG: TonB-dependent receptor plug domain-containing protein [Candidatus Muirbacterium halophilum]|nr:TonB-dependent receptor plug domain-containing protein [Candidatus Muirbacterium halophilum]MCK9476686.1 TonB-dependent receptor plug domain-containing protein [Candidatus Muirbacterium halophilum]
MKRLVLMFIVLFCFVSFGESYWDIGNFLIKGKKNDEISKTVQEVDLHNDNKIRIDNFEDVFRFFPNININDGDRNADIKVEGFNSLQYGVTLDGVTVYAVYDNYLDITQLPINDISKFRIVRGVDALLNGPDSPGVSIELETQKPVFASKSTLDMSVFDYNGRKINFKQEGKKGDFAYIFGYNKKKADGWGLSKSYTPNAIEDGGLRLGSDYDRENFNIYLGKVNDNIEHGLRITTITNENGIPVFTSGKTRYWRYTDWDKKQYSYNYIKKTQNSRIEAILFRDTYYNLLDSYDDNTFSTQATKKAFHSTHDDVSDGLRIVPEFKLKNMDLSLLLYYKNDEHTEQDDIGKAWEEFSSKTYSYALASDFRNGFKAGLAWSEKKIGKNNIGATSDGFEDTNYSVEYEFDKNTSIEISQKHRFPSIKEMFSGYMGGILPNPNLETEKITTYAYYKNYGQNKHRLKTRLYLNKVEDQIEKVDTGILDPFSTKGYNYDQNQNIGDVYYTGVSFDYIKKNINSDFGIIASYIDPENKTGTDKKIDNFAKVNIDINYTNIYKNNKLTWNIHHTGESYENDGAWQTIPSYNLVNIYYDNSIFVNNSTRKFYINIKNIFDKDYYANLGKPCEGKSFEFGQMISW